MKLPGHSAQNFWIAKSWPILDILDLYLLCNKPECYHSTRKTQVTERIFKMNLIHASVIYRIHWITEFNESSAPFRKNSIIYFEDIILVYIIIIRK